MKNANIHKDKEAFIEELHEYYTSIASAKELDWDTVYEGAEKVASRWFDDKLMAVV